MIKLFISQPMAGKTAEEIKAEREQAAIKAAKRVGETVLVLDSIVQAPEGVNRGLWSLGESLKIMAEANMVYSTTGWRAAQGCILEHLAAEAYGLTTMEEADDV